MEGNKILIIALIAIIIALLVGIAFVMPNLNKEDTNLTFKCKSTLTEGDYIKFKLTDANGTALANKTVNITITDSNGSCDYHSVATNAKGIGKLKLDKSPGKYNISIEYLGDDDYNTCNATKKVTVEEVVAVVQEAPSQSQSLPYSLDNLPPSNDPYAETNRYQIDEYTVAQDYEDGYRSYVDLRTGERTSGGFR